MNKFYLVLLVMYFPILVGYIYRRTFPISTNSNGIYSSLTFISFCFVLFGFCGYINKVYLDSLPMGVAHVFIIVLAFAVGQAIYEPKRKAKNE
jgi:hypothetical protein